MNAVPGAPSPGGTHSRPAVDVQHRLEERAVDGEARGGGLGKTERQDRATPDLGLEQRERGRQGGKAEIFDGDW